MRLALAIPFLLVLPAQAQVAVDVELVLLADVSASIDDDEYALQKAGYAKAFRSPDLLEAIRSGINGRIAVTYVEWDKQPRQIVGWSLVDGPDSAARFADGIMAAERHATLGSTGVASALAAAAALLDNGYDGLRRVVDVSGDGAENTGADAAAARDAALGGGVSAINGIVVGTEAAPREFYYADVVGGGRSFLMVTDDYRDFEDAIRRKLVLEIAAR
ncbi:MAG: DUF1194 domain-containing protein [Pseudomonadota bacterium]